MIHAGLAVATSAKRALARVYGLPITALEGVWLERILWMPAHKSAAHVGKLRLRNGDLLTKEDVKGNDGADSGADSGAKEGGEEHRVPPAVVQEWYAAEKEGKKRAMWIGRAASLANNLPEFPFKDNEAARWKADRSKKEKKANKAAKERRKPNVISTDQGGHRLVKELQTFGIRSGSRCTVCKCPSASKAQKERRNSMMGTAESMLGRWSGAQLADPMRTRRRTAWGRYAKVP